MAAAAQDSRGHGTPAAPSGSSTDSDKQPIRDRGAGLLKRKASGDSHAFAPMKPIPASPQIKAGFASN
jgi:hypothetical protein